MLVIGLVKPRDEPYVQRYTEDVEIQPWKHAKAGGIAVIVLVGVIYVLFNEIANK